MEQHQSYYHLWYRGPRRRRDKGEENLFKKIIAENFLNFRKKNRGPVSTESQKMNLVNLKNTKFNSHKVVAFLFTNNEL